MKSNETFKVVVYGTLLAGERNERWAAGAAARNAPYFDGASFAPCITCPIRFVAGFGDCACPPASVYAAYNCVPSADKAIFNGIGMGHGVFPRFYDELGAWVRTGHV